jgi:hypothetical protein
LFVVRLVQFIEDKFHLSFDDGILLYNDLRFFGRNSLLLNFGLLGEGKGNESETQNLQKFKRIEIVQYLACVLLIHCYFYNIFNIRFKLR